MEWDWKEYRQQKHQFKSYYCLECKQRKPCQLLTGWDSKLKNYCCSCYYQSERARAEEYSSYEEVLASKQREKKEQFQQLQLLKSYSSCKQCRSKEADAYSLYENNRLVCQPCLMSKEGGSSSPISFTEQRKWYKKHWGINLDERLENFSQLPVNAECAKKWLKDSKHLDNCQCLETEAQKLIEMFANSLKENEEKLKDCQCEKSEKVRVSYYDFANYGYAYCPKCETKIEGAGKHGTIKNRNDPKFWGLNIEEKVLCLECLQKFQEKMPLRKKYLFNEYSKRGYWSKI